ncbi:2-keto-4-pentenoate hydratase [Pengzhenrongella frigida]|uniref:2-keto-4-pentenoate hydratase n=1 Tax=Pengzhenrongella frigida TaxID=1259133 RepID=A0A4Q5N2X6_9MICO|nr:fumarylacetoacetate hydrolase family protein [Cellulomonas sp. HLT2-17]RYV52539.1 2-keto-4-pentenoate hydratase [Cellulomonas sp. HLT2-17]
MDVLKATEIARALVSARRRTTHLMSYPGEIPATLEEAYQVQDLAIAMCGEQVRGWKVGLVQPAWRDVAGVERLVGPIFAPNVWTKSTDGTTPLPVIVGGTACVEAEIVLEVGVDIEPGARAWSLEDARRCLAGLHPAVELAGSPVAGLNALGPIAVASDFGNNAGLLVGPSADVDPDTWASMRCHTWVDGELVGSAPVSTIPGGPLEAFRFALETITARGRGLTAGDLIATGAVTGVHDVVAGQSAHIEFGDMFDVDIAFVDGSRPGESPRTPSSLCATTHGKN